MKQDWTRLRPILEQLLELPEEAHAAWLDEACGGDEELRRRALELYAAEGDGAYLAPPERPASNLALRPGARLGAWSLVEEIGSGGMGTVWSAERADGEFEMRAALKVLRAGGGGGDLLERFRIERQVLAGLEHPNIAHLVDGGATDDGLPFLVMELVEGEPIDRWCTERDLSVRERLELFLAVCDAVRFAHQSLVVHRDLKPSNVLVTADGRPKLLDFGIAKILRPETAGEGDLTLTGQRQLTPHYASPEQVGGRAITTASDVYSLGVLLYELVAGKRPYDLSDTSLVEMVRIVCEEEPPPASSVAAPELGRQVSGDLDTIVATALSKAPERRYGSVAAFAEDIERLLRREPIHARPPSAAYHLHMFVRRNRALVGAAAVVLVALVGAVIVSTSFAIEARASETETALQLEATEKAQKETAAQLVETRAANARTEEMKRSLVDFGFQVIGNLNQQAQVLGVSTDARVGMVGAAVDQLDWLAERGGDDPQVGVALAKSYIELGNLLGNSRGFNLGDREGAAECYEKARAIAERLMVEHPAPKLPVLLAEVHLSLGDAARDEMAIQEALEHYERSLELEQESGFDDVHARSRRVKLLTSIGNVKGFSKDDAGALEYYEKALPLQREIHEELQSRESVLDLTAAMTKVGVANLRLDRYEEAAGLLEDSLRLKRELLLDDPDDMRTRGDVVQVRLVLVEILTKLQRFEEGRSQSEAAREELDVMLESDPKNVYHSINGVLIAMNAGRNELAWGLALIEGDEPGEGRARLELARRWLEEGLAAYDELSSSGRAPAWMAAEVPADMRAALEQVLEALGEP